MNYLPEASLVLLLPRHRIILSNELDRRKGREIPSFWMVASQLSSDCSAPSSENAIQWLEAFIFPAPGMLWGGVVRNERLTAWLCGQSDKCRRAELFVACPRNHRHLPITGLCRGGIDKIACSMRATARCCREILLRLHRRLGAGLRPSGTCRLERSPIWHAPLPVKGSVIPSCTGRGNSTACRPGGQSLPGTPLIEARRTNRSPRKSHALRQALRIAGGAVPASVPSTA